MGGQGTLEVPWAVTEFQNAGSFNVRQNGQYPTSPAPKRYQCGDQIIGPGEGVIQQVEGNTQERLEQAETVCLTK